MFDMFDVPSNTPKIKIFEKLIFSLFPTVKVMCISHVKIKRLFFKVVSGIDRYEKFINLVDYLAVQTCSLKFVLR